MIKPVKPKNTNINQNCCCKVTKTEKLKDSVRNNKFTINKPKKTSKFSIKIADLTDAINAYLLRLQYPVSITQ